MWIFGKKSNQPATSSELPPELRPFYGQQNVNKLRTSQLVAIIAAVIIVAALVFLVVWLNGQSVNVKQAKSTTQSSAQTAKSGQSTQSSTPSQTQTGTTSTAQSAESTTPSTMPNTGPGTEMFIVAISAAVLGVVFYHFRQLKKLSN